MQTIFFVQGEGDDLNEFAPVDLANIPREGDEVATRNGVIYRVVHVIWMPYGRAGGESDEPCVVVALAESDADSPGGQWRLTIRVGDD